MPKRQEFEIELQPLVTKRSRRIAWVAAATIPVGLACLIAFAWIGGDRPAGPADPAIQRPSGVPPSTAVRTAATSSPDGTPGRSAEATVVPTPDSAAHPERLAMADFGYQVASDPSAIGPPIAQQDGRVVVFRSGGWQAPDGVVAVGVGTPDQAARVFGSDGSVRVYGATLSDLERDFREKSRDRVVSSAAIRVDGVAARLLAVESFPPEVRSVVLVVRASRSYVIAAWGFSSLYPGNLTNATRLGLSDFLRRFHFLDG